MTAKRFRMRNVIYETVVLPAPSEKLFAMYLDPSTHASITGSPVLIGEESGSQFEAFGGMLTGTILQVVHSRLIVQSWRSSNFRTEDPESTLILAFTPEGAEGRIDLVHVDVPDHDYEGVTKGWDEYYWKPWRKYLESLGE